MHGNYLNTKLEKNVFFCCLICVLHVDSGVTRVLRSSERQIVPAYLVKMRIRYAKCIEVDRSAFQRMLGLMASMSPVLQLGLLCIKSLQYWLKPLVPPHAWPLRKGFKNRN